MNTITFDKLLLKTAFCCMACDGNIDKREIALIKSLCSESPLFANFDFQTEINVMISKINADGKDFIKHYFSLLHSAQLTEEEEVILIDFALKTINADEVVEYSEVKFFKAIRSRLQISNDKIISLYPETEYYLEEDIDSDNYLEKIVNQYFDTVELPQFGHMEIDSE